METSEPKDFLLRSETITRTSNTIIPLFPKDYVFETAAHSTRQGSPRCSEHHTSVLSSEYLSLEIRVHVSILKTQAK